MLSKNEIKYYASLLQKKYRKEENKFIIDGKKIVEEGLNSPEWQKQCEVILVSTSFSEDFSEYVLELQKHFLVEIVHNKDFERLSDTQNPQGIAAVFKIPDESGFNFKSNQVIALEEISDPGNLGTILRNCDWFGITEVLLSENCVELYNPKVLRASMGSVFHLRILKAKDFTKTLSQLKQEGFKLFCADINGSNIFTHNKSGKSIITFCNESFGPSPELLNIIDTRITIPKLGNAESLNVACASAVIIAEMTKRL